MKQNFILDLSLKILIISLKYTENVNYERMK